MQKNVSTLPDDPAALKEIIVDLHDRFDKETGILLEQIRHLRAQLFGRKSEEIRPEGGPQPLPLFDMPEPEVREEGEAIEVPAHQRRKSGRKPLPEELPRVEVMHDIAAADKVCGCGRELSRIGEEVSEQLDIIPAKIQVIRHIRPKYACRNCEGVEADGPARRSFRSPSPVPACWPIF